MPAVPLLSRVVYNGDSLTTIWNFAFSSGYLDKTHVKAYTVSPTGVRADLIVTDGDFVGPYQLRVVPAVPSGYTLVIYRDTPKDAALVDFTDGAELNEASLDRVAKQAVFATAEVLDLVRAEIQPDFNNAAAQVASDRALAEAARDTAVAVAAGMPAAVAAEMQPYITSASSYAAAASASAAAAAASEADAEAASTLAANSAAVAADAEDNIVQIAGTLAGSFGFNGTAFDMGFVSDTTTYLNLDCGVL